MLTLNPNQYQNKRVCVGLQLPDDWAVVVATRKDLRSGIQYVNRLAARRSGLIYYVLPWSRTTTIGYMGPVRSKAHSWVLHTAKAK